MNRVLFQKLLFAWFKKHGRVLPWRVKDHKDAQSIIGVRETLATYFTKSWQRDPYRVIVSELMLQQTQVDRVLPKFEHFMNKWPTVFDLAQASLSEVMIAWQGLGYNRRARFLHEMAKIVVKKYNGIFPKTEQELQKLPGIGEYTARAVLTFAYGQDIGVIDTNIKRIFSRVEFGVEPTAIPVSPKEFQSFIDLMVPKHQGDPWNQTLMDFGALVCTSKSPKCDHCPVKTLCAAQDTAKKHHKKTYAEMLKIPQSIKNKKPSIPFEQTNRYFRGRVVDKLRENPTHMEELRMHMEINHGLTSRKKFGEIIESLVLDKLIYIRGSIVSLD